MTLDPPSNLTVNLRPNPELQSQTTALIALAGTLTVTTPDESLAASGWLAKTQLLRRWISGIYKDAKAPLLTAQRTLGAQEKALLEPLAVAERMVMDKILAFTTAQAEAHAAQDAATVDALLAGEDVPVVMDVVAPALVEGMSTRETVSAEIADLRALVLAVAGQLLLEVPATKSQRAWMIAACQTTPQATLTLLEPCTPALNALARALRTNLNLPGVTLRTTTTLVAR